MSRKTKKEERMPGGWYPRRRGILEHLENGTISLLDSAVHDFLCLTCDHKTGLAWSSAKKIQLLAPVDLNERAVRRSLEKLAELGWIKRWVQKGKRGNYPILIARFYVKCFGILPPSSVRDVSVIPSAKPSANMSVKWWKVNADRTTDWRNIQYDPVREDVLEDVREENEKSEATLPGERRSLSGLQEVKTLDPQEREHTQDRGARYTKTLMTLTAQLQRFLSGHIQEMKSGKLLPIEEVFAFFQTEAVAAGVPAHEIKPLFERAVETARASLGLTLEPLPAVH